MSEKPPGSVEVVRGEMAPWSDYEGNSEPSRGVVLATLLDEVVPAGSRALVLGPHGTDLIAAVAARSAEVTVLVRSVSDASMLSEQAAPNVQVVAGALDGLAAAGRPPFDVLVAADGLDRVLGADSDELDWTQRLDALAGLAAPDAAVILGLYNEFSLTELLDRRPAHERHGDDEWRPLHDDPSRPTSVGQFAAELERAGLGPARLFAEFSVRQTPYALVDVEIAAVTRPGRLPARIAVEGLEASAAAVPLLAPVAESAEAAARAGLLGATPPGWLAVRAPAGHAVYARTPGHGTVLVADPSTEGWDLTVATGETEPDVSAEVRFSAEAIPSHVPDGTTVETVLFRLAAAEDVPGFRGLAARLGAWAREQAGADSQRVLRVDDVVIDGDGFAPGISPWVTTKTESTEDLLAAAWSRLHDRLIGGHRRHPWPPWMVGDDLVTAWLAMSGVEQTPVTRGRELAVALETALGIPSDASQSPDVRTALADAERARVEVVELAGQVFGLERTIGFRDKQLKVRENRIRRLRTEAQKAKTDLERIRGSRAYALAKQIRRASLITKPRKLAGAVKRRVKRAR